MFCLRRKIASVGLVACVLASCTSARAAAPVAPSATTVQPTTTGLATTTTTTTTEVARTTTTTLAATTLAPIVLSETIEPPAPEAEVPVGVAFARELYADMIGQIPLPEVRFSQNPSAVRVGVPLSVWLLRGGIHMSPTEHWTSDHGATLTPLASKVVIDIGDGSPPILCEKLPMYEGDCVITYASDSTGTEFIATVTVTWTFWYFTTDGDRGFFDLVDVATLAAITLAQ